MIDRNRIACFFSTSGHSGVDRAAAHLLPALARRGYRVDLLKVRGHGPHIAAVTDGISVVDLGSRHTYACLPGVARYLREKRPVALLSDKDKVNRIALLGRWLSGVPTRLVFSIGTTVSVNLASRGPLERRLQRLSMGKLYSFAHQVVVSSEGVAEDMSDYTGLARSRIRVVPRPVVPASLFSERQPQPDHPWFGQADSPLILGAGALCARKDFETLLRAFARVRTRQPCRLMILGRGGYRERLLSLAAELGVAKDFSLPGFFPEPYPYIAHADLFALTSRWEGLGFVLVEALALGTPVVATDCPSGPHEILEGGLYGTLVPVGDDATLAEAISAVLTDPLPRERLRQAARRYEIEASADAYLRAMDLPLRCSAS